MALSSNFIDRIFYDAQGHTGNTYYYRLVRRSDGAIGDYTTQAFSTSTTWLNSAHIMAETDSTGGFPVLIDPDAVPAGDTYDVIIYLQAGSIPANTDDVQQQYQMRYGSDFGF